MHLTHLRVTNFRACRHADLDLPARTLVLGLNGAGKTSLLDAIRFALVGRCHDADRAVMLNARMLGDGGKQAEVHAVTDVADVRAVLSRSVTLDVTGPDGKPLLHGTTKDKRGAWPGLVGLPPLHLEACLNPRLYLTASTLGDLLVDLLAGGGIDAAWLRERCGEHYDWLVRTATAERFDLTTAAGLTQLGKWAYDRRTEVNRQVADLQREHDQIGDIGAPLDSQGRPIPIAAHPKVLDSLRTLAAQRDALTQELARATHGRTAAEITAAREKLTQDIIELDALQAPLEAAYETAQRHTREAQDAHSAAQRDGSNAEHQHREAERALAAAEKALASVSHESCPTCGRLLDDATREHVTGPAQAAVEAARARLAETQAARGAAVTAQTAAHQGLIDARQAESDALVRVTPCRTKRMDLESRVRVLNAEKPRDGARTADQIAAEIETLAERIRTGELVREQLVVLAQRDDVARRRDAAVVEQAGLDWATKAFKDGEVLRGAVTGGKETFEAGCNAELEPFGYRLRIAVDGKSCGCELARDGGPWHPVVLCSKAAQTLAGWALAVGFARGGGRPGLVVLDDLDGLDGPNRGRFFARVADYAAAGGQVVMASAWSRPEPVAEVVAGLRSVVDTVVWVEGGTAEVVG